LRKCPFILGRKLIVFFLTGDKLVEGAPQAARDVIERWLGEPRACNVLRRLQKALGEVLESGKERWLVVWIPSCCGTKDLGDGLTVLLSLSNKAMLSEDVSMVELKRLQVRNSRVRCGSGKGERHFIDLRKKDR